MWLKLTLADGKPIRINMNLIDAYLLNSTDGARTQLDKGKKVYMIRETIEMIDKALADPKNPTRVACGW